MLVEKGEHGAERRLRCEGHRIAICPSRQGRKPYTVTLMRHGHGQTFLIGTGELLSFTVLPAVPDGSDRVDDVTRRQLASTRDHSIARRAALGIALTGLSHNIGASGTVDGPIHTAPACQPAVRGVDDGIGGLPCDISCHEFQHTCTNMHLHTCLPYAIMPALDWLAGLLAYVLIALRHSQGREMRDRRSLTPDTCFNVPLYSRMRCDLLGEAGKTRQSWMRPGAVT